MQQTALNVVFKSKIHLPCSGLSHHASHICFCHSGNRNIFSLLIMMVASVGIDKVNNKSHTTIPPSRSCKLLRLLNAMHAPVLSDQKMVSRRPG